MFLPRLPESCGASSHARSTSHVMVFFLCCDCDLGIDLGKTTFHLVGQDECGAIVLRIKLSRTQIPQRLANIPPCLIGMEACAHGGISRSGQAQLGPLAENPP